MQVLFLGLQYDRSREVEYLKISRHGLNAAANEFQWNLCDGLIDNMGSSVRIVSSLPMGTYPKNYEKLLLENRKWDYRNVHIEEMACINLPVIKQIQRINSCYRQIKAWLRETSDDKKLIVVYAIYLPYMQAVSKVLKEEKNLRAVVVVPDLPGRYGILPTDCNYIHAKILSLVGYAGMKLSRNFHGYVLLTEEMRIPLEIKDKPYVIIEGITKASSDAQIPKSCPSPARYILYTGTLAKAANISNLLRAFNKVSDPGAELWICGSGEMQEEIKAQAKKNPRIKYLGFQPKAKILQLQANAAVLVNPRISEGEYTKYSFPSKTIEYMASGTPVVMHRLPGIPGEYGDYLIYAEDDSYQALAEALDRVLSWSQEQRKDFGEQAKIFVQEHKSPSSQAKKLLDMARQLF